MTVRTDFYQIVLWFPRLFPDPAIFEDSNHLAKRYLTINGLAKEKSELVYQNTDDITPLDDSGGPCSTSGTAKYPFEGRMIPAEYMSNANIRLEYADFGTGLTPGDHSKIWNRGKLGELRFELRDFKHRSNTLDVPEASELYGMLKPRATPSALSTLELENVPGNLFRAVVSYIAEKLKTLAASDSLDVEVYSARELSASEKRALEERLTRESTNSTVFIMLSSQSIRESVQTIG